MSKLVVSLVVVCTFLLAVPALSAPIQPRYVDQVGLLNSVQTRELTSYLDGISNRQGFDVVIAVVDDLDYRDPVVFALDFFEENGFGYGPNEDGAILLLAMAERDFAFAAVGYGVYAFTEQGQVYLDKLFLPELRESRYFEAFVAFADAVDDFLIMAKNGTPYTAGNIPLTPEEEAQRRNLAIGASLVVAFLFALITTLVERGKLKSVWEEKYAEQYIKAGSLVLAGQRDVFLYRHVAREAKAEKESSSKTSSSGRSGTGHSGKF